MRRSEGLLGSFNLLWTLGMVWGQCGWEELRQGLGLCELESRRTAVYYWTNCTLPPPPAFHFPCDLECPAGSYLTADPNKRLTMCKVCPANWYSEGGAKAWEEQWQGVWRHFGQRCEGGGTECPNWVISDNGLYLETALTGISNRSYETTLLGRFHLVKPGVFSLHYRRMFTGNLTSFQVRINTFPIRIDTSLSPAWQVLDAQLLAGVNEIAISYQFPYFPHTPTQAQIRLISIPGIDYADFTCKPCPPGLISAKGARGCQVCSMNSVFNRTIQGCSPCSAEDYALPGASKCSLRPACDPKDYIIVTPPCLDGRKDISSQWKKPLICDWKHYQLPEDQFNLPCGKILCPAGFQKQGEECEICPEGRFSREGESCQPCPAGFIPLKRTNFSHWEQWPTGFESYCEDINGRKCEYSQGWVLAGTRLESGVLSEEPARVILSLTANFTSFPAAVDFAYSFPSLKSSNSSLLFRLNNVILKKYHTQSSLAHIEIETLGATLLSWEFVSSFPDSAALSWIVLTGSELSPSATCMQCLSGTVSGQGQGKCEVCPAGTAADSSHSQCTVCPRHLVSGRAGQDCELCPLGTEAKGTFCQLREWVELDKVVIYMGKLEKGRIGPINGILGSYYLSLFEPVRINEYTDKEEPEKAFLYGTRGESIEAARNSPIKASFGSQFEAITYDGNVLIRFGQGSKCDIDERPFSSLIQLICDPKNENSWPKVTLETACSVELQWTIRHFCPVCKPSETQNRTFPCSNGLRWTRISDSETCYWPGSSFVSEPCSESLDLLFTGEAGIGVAMVTGLIGVLVLTWKRKNREKRLFELRIRQGGEDFLHN